MKELAYQAVAASCDEPKDRRPASITRRRFGALTASAALSLSAWAPIRSASAAAAVASQYPAFDEAVAKVSPAAGFQSRIALKDSVLRLVRHGVIDPGKFFSLGLGGDLRGALANVLREPSDQPILLTAANATAYVNLLWPIGLSTYMNSNASSPLAGQSRFNLASTAGWPLGREDNGGVYFSRYPIVDLDQANEALVVNVAKSTFRPCCDNSTFFQDCNHGSALLGLLQLGASQGLTERELYDKALAYNSFWYPNNYVMTALYLKVFRDTDWESVDSREVMSAEFSTLSGWRRNVEQPLSSFPNLIPAQQNGVNCGW